MRVIGEKAGIIVCSFGLFCIISMNCSAAAQESGYAFGIRDRDPMAPLIDNNGGILIAKELDVDGFALKGIIYSATMPLAVINDEVLSEGDTLGGYTITEITETAVSLQKDDKGFTLKLEEE